MSRENIYKLAEDIRDGQSSIVNDMELTMQETREIRSHMAQMAKSQQEISMSLSTLTTLQETLIKRLLPFTIGMVFVLALLFAGVRFYEIAAFIRPGFTSENNTETK